MINPLDQMRTLEEIKSWMELRANELTYDMYKDEKYDVEKMYNRTVIKLLKALELCMQQRDDWNRSSLLMATTDIEAEFERCRANDNAAIERTLQGTP